MSCGDNVRVGKTRHPKAAEKIAAIRSYLEEMAGRPLTPTDLESHSRGVVKRQLWDAALKGENGLTKINWVTAIANATGAARELVLRLLLDEIGIQQFLEQLPAPGGTWLTRLPANVESEFLRAARAFEALRGATRLTEETIIARARAAAKGGSHLSRDEWLADLDATAKGNVKPAATLPPSPKSPTSTRGRRK